MGLYHNLKSPWQGGWYCNGRIIISKALPSLLGVVDDDFFKTKMVVL